MNDALPPDPAQPDLPAFPGQRLQRGVLRLMREMGHAALSEYSPARGLRVDVIALTSAGEVWIVECKSSRADFTSDRKWQGYLDYCDRYFWAVDRDFPQDLLPGDAGLIVADGYGAELLREPVPERLAGARRTRILRDFARIAAWRLQDRLDPNRIG